MTPGDPVVGGTVLRRAAIQSPNYVQGVSGWTINADGSAEFNDVTIRGSLVGTTQFNYSGAPGAGNLVQTSGIITPGTDGFGNNYLTGDTTYSTANAASLDAGFISLYSGSLAGGWTLQATIETDFLGDLLLAVTGSGSIQLASAAVAGSSLEVQGTLDVTSNLIEVGSGSITETNFNMSPAMGSTTVLATLVAEMTNRGMIS